MKVGYSNYRLAESEGEYQIQREHTHSWPPFEHQFWSQAYGTKTYKNKKNAERAYNRFIEKKQTDEHAFSRSWNEVK